VRTVLDQALDTLELQPLRPPALAWESPRALIGGE
jgi:hypothetical protein